MRFVLPVIAAVLAYLMYARTAREELWGYLPLWFYLSCWASVVVFSLRSPLHRRPRNTYLSTATGLLLGLGFPGYVPLPFLLLVAWVPLLWLQREAKSWRTVFWHGLNAFVLYNILASFWVTNTAFAAGLFAVAVNSLLMTLPWLAFHWTRRRVPRVAYLGLVACWLSFEYLHYNWSLNWPWLTLGNGFAQFPSLVQWYEVTGVLGGSAWILGVNILLAKRAYRAAALLVTIPLLASLVRYATYTPPAGKTITVASIQPNLEPHFEKFTLGRGAQLRLFTDLSRQALSEGPVDYLLFPETSFSRVDEADPDADPSLRTLRDALPTDRVRYLVTGYDGYYRFQAGEPVSEAVRYLQDRDGSQIAFEALNGAVQFDLSDGDVQTYRKGVFVPGAESFPFRRVLFFLEPLVNSLGGTVAGRGSQSERTPFTSPTGRVAPVICYESVFGEYFTGYVREGAQAAFVMTNDGWWDETPGYRQHLWFASLRAIETRRAIVRSANMGACAFIDQRGTVEAATPYGRRGYLRGNLQLNDAVTPYVRFGDITARIALLLAAMALLNNLAHSLRRSS